MATVIRDTEPSLSEMVTAFNQLKAQIGAGALAHLDATEYVCDIDRTTDDLPGVIASLNQAKAVYNRHIADTLAHSTADVTNAVTSPNASDQTSANTLANALKAKIVLHIDDGGHYNDVPGDDVTETDATTLNSSRTLADAIWTHLISHIASAPSAPSLRLVGA